MAAAGERSGQPNLHDVQCEAFRNHALAEGEDVAVVVFAGQASGFEIPAEGAADAFDFIGDDGFAVSRAAEDDAAVEFAAGDGFGSGANENGIIHRRVAEGAEIADIVTHIVQEDFDFLFVVKASVVGSDGDLHGGKTISRETRVSSSSSPWRATTPGQRAGLETAPRTARKKASRCTMPSTWKCRTELPARPSARNRQEVDMFSRVVSMQLKPNTHREFSELFDKQILPTLRKQQGFRDEMLFVDPGGPEVVAISLWESRENAETYNRATYPEVLKTLAKVIEGPPEVRTFQLAYSSFHKIAIGVAANQSAITSPTAGVGG
jgi:quinol monooxygenase YgiN